MTHSQRIKQMFNSISPTYDTLNHLMSFGFDILWRNKAVQSLPSSAEEILDIGTGTGDLVISAARKNQKLKGFGLDFAAQMVKQAKLKTQKKHLTERISYITGDGLNLPFPDKSFDAVTIAFCLRNIDDKKAALVEMARVLRNGGKVIVLEMTFPENIGFRKFFNIYLDNLIPLIGRSISRDAKAYRYLPVSIKGFVKPDELTILFNEAGLERVKYTKLSFGIAYIHEGYVHY
ncbi:MAG: bifunctional demethylmenaquinone methyltransferase/2-methoxy-6-polyprenyl-1,4-benzoquinol methylase UbiE [Candidatus Electryonea clarkiae]|nr:bifunctional demethylmenaquinone methyltransferase/2-methoxy-6-polyprenyl-1,4-benzoquinol methylase UbiE [Candidatus Electryonea clarkiae]MDP8287867.1 bifunctional demethylmenaquinone methyltransferase/2-methoxy-6-polyprenyl-1,4-benzoquinol methylase UbiE [Candidatus Electryonea clarkiae]